jgi:hypothetical protein
MNLMSLFLVFCYEIYCTVYIIFEVVICHGYVSLAGTQLAVAYNG